MGVKRGRGRIASGLWWSSVMGGPRGHVRAAAGAGRGLEGSPRRTRRAYKRAERCPEPQQR